MPYEVHISEINVLTFSQSVAVLKILVIAKNGMLEMIMLSLLPKGSTTTE